VTNLGFAVAVAVAAVAVARIILILQLLPTLGLVAWLGNLRVPCIGFESILLGCTIL
jgi:hypothetical protein